MDQHCYHREHLPRFGEIEGAGELTNKLFDYYGAVFDEGALTEVAHVTTAIRGGESVAHGVQVADQARQTGI